MPLADDRWTFTVPVTLKAHHMARQFYRCQSTRQKARQVYLNTLAVQSVRSYLLCFGIDPQLEISDSWNSVMHLLSDTADLMIVGKGKLECRPVLPQETVCRVPPDVWQDRIGYVAVQFDQELKQATLLGFASRVTSSDLPLNQLRSLSELVEHLSDCQSIDQITDQTTRAPVQLGQWLHGQIEAGWQTIEQLFGLRQPVWNVRSGCSLPTSEPLTRGKIVTLTSSDLDSVAVALLVSILPTATQLVEVWVKVCAPEPQTCLPATLEVSILDQANVAVMQAQSRSTEMIQLKFSGMTGETFGVKVAQGSASTTEIFVL